MPITLLVNKFIGTLTNLIAYSEVLDTIQGGVIDSLLNECREYDVANGNGKIVLTTDLPEVSDLPVNSTLLSTVKPKIYEQYLPVNNYKTVQLTINRWLMRGAFLEETAMSNLIAYLLYTMRKAKDVFIYNQIINEYKSLNLGSELGMYAEDNDAASVTINLYNTDGITDMTQLEAVQKINGQIIYRNLLNIVSYMQFPNGWYEDGNGVFAGGNTAILDPSSIMVLMPYSLQNTLTVDTLAGLLNSSKITNAIKWDKTILTEDMMTQVGGAGSTANTIYVTHKKKVQYGYFYNVATSFFDASNLNENQWLHFAYYLGSIKTLPCVAIRINYVDVPQA